MNMAMDRSGRIDASVQAEDTRPAAFFQEAYQAFQRAEEAAGGPADRFYNIGEYMVRLRFAGSALIPFITPALEHLAAKHGSAPALTVCLWDRASTHTEMPPCPWATDDYDARGEVRDYNNDRIHIAFHLGAGVLSMLDTRLDLALCWIRDARQLPYYRSAAPLLTILHWWMRNRGRQLGHAAAVGTPRGGVLIPGKSGSGKSTIALACLHSELLYIGDDYVLLSGQPIPFAYSLYNSAKLDPDHIKRFPHLWPTVSNPGRLDKEKALIFLHNHYPHKVTMGFPVRAILLPCITGLPETRLEKASPAASLIALAPSTIFRLPGARHEAFQNLADFVKQVPSYVLELGTDLVKIPGVILGLLSEN
jgi:hypothetical protein